MGARGSPGSPATAAERSPARAAAEGQVCGAVVTKHAVIDDGRLCCVDLICFTKQETVCANTEKYQFAAAVDIDASYKKPELKHLKMLCHKPLLWP